MTNIQRSEQHGLHSTVAIVTLLSKPFHSLSCSWMTWLQIMETFICSVEFYQRGIVFPFYTICFVVIFKNWNHIYLLILMSFISLYTICPFAHNTHTRAISWKQNCICCFTDTGTKSVHKDLQRLMGKNSSGLHRALNSISPNTLEMNWNSNFHHEWPSSCQRSVPDLLCSSGLNEHKTTHIFSTIYSRVKHESCYSSNDGTSQH